MFMNVCFVLQGIFFYFAQLMKRSQILNVYYSAINEIRLYVGRSYVIICIIWRDKINPEGASSVWSNYCAFVSFFTVINCIVVIQ